MSNEQNENKQNVLLLTFKEVTQPFIDLAKAPRALWGINLSYLLEGLTYFGVLSLLAMYFNGIGLNDVSAGQMVGFQTAGITIAMLVFGATVDIIGVRKSLLVSLSLMLIGRVILSSGNILSSSHGMWSAIHIISLIGMLGIISGYGIYQPACYAGVKRFTDEKTSAMGYAMLYAIMNLGGFLPGLISPPVRKSFGISGVFWVYSALTLLGILVVYFILTKKAVDKATLTVLNEEPKEKDTRPVNQKVKDYVKRIPYKDFRFLFFIFILIPVQTLFAHNWLTLPQYCARAFTGTVSDNFEFFVNLNPILIFILTPSIAAITSKKNTYRMMIIGTSVMGLAPFILASGPSTAALLIYLVVMTIGEAMWQPRFLQWVAEIAPKDMTGIYMGIGQFPWFMTKMITSLYSGWFLMKFCPQGVTPAMTNTGTMWLIYGFIAIISPISLILAKNWMVKGFKTKH